MKMTRSFDLLNAFVWTALGCALLFGFCGPAWGMVIFRYEKVGLQIELQRRPWSWPTAKLTKANQTLLSTLTKRYAVFVTNPAGTVILEAAESDSLDEMTTLMQSKVKTFHGETIPKFDPIRHKIVGCKIHVKP